MGASKTDRWSEKGSRPVRVANCSGCMVDPPYQMRWQAELGDVDFITGDYLGEGSIGENAMGMSNGKHEGYEPNALEAIAGAIDILAAKRIKVIVDGGALNPKLLAERVQKLVTEGGYDMKVAYVDGDDCTARVKSEISKGLPAHLDSSNPSITFRPDTFALTDTENKPVISAVAYLGAREIVKGLEAGADIIIAGSVADASPVIAAAWWWHSWSDTDYDQLAGALIAGHLIECASYMTGANFAGFYEHDLDQFIDLPYGIVEIDNDGTCIATKHDNTKGLVTRDVILCQLLYELQGNIYLNSDVKAYLDDVAVENVGENRVRVSGVRGGPPPPTTKLAVFYLAGYQCELYANATGYATDKKWEHWEKMFRFGLTKRGVINDFETLEFQIVGTPAKNPQSQLESTTYLRIFAHAAKQETILAIAHTFAEFAIQHFSGYHSTMDTRTMMPKVTHNFYPGTIRQDELDCGINLIDAKTGKVDRISGGHPSKYEALEPRPNYDTASPIDLASFGPTKTIRLGDITLARSGDKGANINFGIFVRDAAQWPWFRSFMTREKMKELMGKDWQDTYFLERVEFPNVLTVHFVIYGILGKGVCGSSRLDALGKGFADYIRDKEVDVPVRFLPKA